MPELPDVDVYVERLSDLLVGQPLVALELRSPFLLRTVAPRPDDALGRAIRSVSRLGKRIVVEFDRELLFVLHLMIAGRLRWRPPEGKLPGGKHLLATFAFPRGTLALTEAGSKKRASLHVVAGRRSLGAFDRGGVEPLETDFVGFCAALRRENHTLKRALTDPRLVSGIGNAYSDEILHAAQLSPLSLTGRLAEDDARRLFDATSATLRAWRQRLRDEVGDGFPEKVTAFREGMAVHGRYREPCPVCGTPVQRIRYASNECNYCPRCQTGGKLLADRSLSRLLEDDWPRSIEELEERLGRDG